MSSVGKKRAINMHGSSFGLTNLKSHWKSKGIISWLQMLDSTNSLVHGSAQSGDFVIITKLYIHTLRAYKKKIFYSIKR